MSHMICLFVYRRSSQSLLWVYNNRFFHSSRNISVFEIPKNHPILEYSAISIQIHLVSCNSIVSLNCTFSCVDVTGTNISRFGFVFVGLADWFCPNCADFWCHRSVFYLGCSLIDEIKLMLSR